jgi:hypothetical protein
MRVQRLIAPVHLDMPIDLSRILRRTVAWTLEDGPANAQAKRVAGDRYTKDEGGPSHHDLWQTLSAAMQDLPQGLPFLQIGTVGGGHATNFPVASWQRPLASICG